MPKIFEVDPLFIEAQYAAGDNPLQLELMGADAASLDAGGGSSASSGSGLGGGDAFLADGGGGLIENGGGRRYDGFDSERDAPFDRELAQLLTF